MTSVLGRRREVPSRYLEPTTIGYRLHLDLVGRTIRTTDEQVDASVVHQRRIDVESHPDEARSDVELDRGAERFLG
jgi:hypothetical protein